MQDRLMADRARASVAARQHGTDAAIQCQLMVACAAGSLSEVIVLLATGAEVNYVNSQGETPLSFAAAWRRRSVLDCLLAMGARPDLPSTAGWSPLMYAASVGDEGSVISLLAAGADIARRDSLGRSAADLARLAGHATCARMIESQMSSSTAQSGPRPRPVAADRHRARSPAVHPMSRRTPRGSCAR
jgi:ankyrin repeat protein